MRAPNKKDNMKNAIIQAMHAKYEAEYELSKAMIDSFLKNLVGVGEHIDYATPIEKELKRMTEMKDLMDALENFL